VGHKTRSEAKAGDAIRNTPSCHSGQGGRRGTKVPFAAALGKPRSSRTAHHYSHHGFRGAHPYFPLQNWLRMLVTNLNTTSTSTLYYYYSRRKL
jgi:hypothetical protein